MDGNLTDQEKEKIINFGAISFSIEKMAIVLERDESVIAKLMNDKKSEFYKLYQKGEAVAEYLLQTKLFEMAKAGDVKAYDKYVVLKRVNNRKL